MGLRVRVLTQLSEVEALTPAWNTLVEGSASATSFQTPAWCLAVMRNLFPEKPSRARIAVVEDGKGLILTAPLAIAARNGVRMLQWLGEPLSAYGDVVARPGCDVAAVMQQVLDHMQARGDQIDVVHLPKTRVDATVTPFLKKFERLPSTNKIAPLIDLRRFPDFEAYVASRSSKAMKSYRRKRRRLAEEGDLDFRVHSSGRHAAELARVAFDLKIQWMKTHGKVSRIFAHPAFLDALLDFVGQEGSGAFVSALSLDDHPIALEIGFAINRCYYSYLGAMDLAFSRFSPGQLQLLESLRWSFENGIETFDFLPSDSEYKRAWAPESTEQSDWIFACSYKGALYGKLVLNSVLPLSRRLYTRAPLSVRKPTQSMIHRLLKE